LTMTLTNLNLPFPSCTAADERFCDTIC